MMTVDLLGDWRAGAATCDKDDDGDCCQAKDKSCVVTHFSPFELESG